MIPPRFKKGVAVKENRDGIRNVQGAKVAEVVLSSRFMIIIENTGQSPHRGAPQGRAYVYRWASLVVQVANGRQLAGYGFVHFNSVV